MLTAVAQRAADALGTGRARRLAVIAAVATNASRPRYHHEIVPRSTPAALAPSPAITTGRLMARYDVARKADVTPPRAWSGAMRWIVDIVFGWTMPPPMPASIPPISATSRPPACGEAANTARPTTIRTIPMRNAGTLPWWRRSRSWVAPLVATTAAANRPATIGWVTCTPSCSCRNDGDSPSTQPISIQAVALASVAATHGRRIVAGTWRAGGRFAGAGTSGRVSGMRSSARASALATTMSRTNGATVGQGVTVASTPPTSGPSVKPAAAATIAASAPLPACWRGCSSRMVTVDADITRPAAIP